MMKMFIEDVQILLPAIHALQSEALAAFSLPVKNDVIKLSKEQNPFQISLTDSKSV